MTVFFTSDTHFGHARIIELCNRPFKSVEEMDEEMIARWNKIVRPQDTVMHIGDFCMGNGEEASQYLRRLNGHIHLVWGNHDKPQVRLLDTWMTSGPLVEMSLDGYRLTFCHYAMRVWNKSHREDGRSLMLFGHSHGMLPGTKQSADVGVDCWDFHPVLLDEVIYRMDET